MSACLRCLLSSRTSKNWKRQFCKEKVHCLPRYSLLLDHFSLPSSAALSPFGKVLAGWMLLSVVGKIVYRILGVCNSTVGRQRVIIGIIIISWHRVLLLFLQNVGEVCTDCIPSWSWEHISAQLQLGKEKLLRESVGMLTMSLLFSLSPPQALAFLCQS